MKERCQGTVVYFNRGLGYGFVVQHGHRDQIFVRCESIESPTEVLSEGQDVSFVVDLRDGRWEAAHVRV
ncbi:cold shock domain-containing protein [Streptomyces sp. NBC_00237]|uniref:cold shock domain-containing protein n=1 Tax=Streptomyces sp. NBC_00237 TaxID=2975687 RepID=UPI002251EEFE|nr:cold shock domain-containing protein [Streptomyces sp. NBC_00237]MCX5205940.1 cold shock domain-containing protein [Streptomyces sp. NBC_00237]